MRKHSKNTESRPGLWSAFLNRINSWRKPLGVFAQEEEYLERTETGIRVFQGKDFCWKLDWDEVTGVFAYKLDAWSFDVICFAFQRGTEPDAVWCIHENMPGYKEITSDIERITEGGWPARFADVAHPAFEFNWTEIWKAPDSVPLNENPMHFIWKKIPDELLPESYRG
ncbi:MAG: hypothetical protein JKX70_05350 [Phycisphaerales bacterium]|nr:hypothetical protein [Phycisphaerales bacterium]